MIIPIGPGRRVPSQNRKRHLFDRLHSGADLVVFLGTFPGMAYPMLTQVDNSGLRLATQDTVSDHYL